jgi:hypothetical protein
MMSDEDPEDRMRRILTMPYETSSEREKNVQEARAKLDEALYSFNRSAPRPFMDENAELYRKRTLPMVQEHAPNFRNIKVEDARGSAFDLLERQIYEDAHREARHPTQIPEGELREVRRKDASGREMKEFFGSPSAWLSDFSYPKKRLVGIYAPDIANMKKV